jgi:hypothetical protein
MEEKMKKKKLLLLLLTFLMLPFVVHAEDDPLLYEKLDEALGGNHKIVITDKTLRNGYLLGTPNEQEPESDFDGLSKFATAYIKDMPEIQEFLREYSDYHPVIDVYCKVAGHCGIKIKYDFDARGECSQEELEAQEIQYPGCFYTDYEVEIETSEEYDADVYSSLLTTIGYNETNGLPEKNYYLYDLAYINQLYNQNYGDRNLIEEKGRNAYFDLIAKSFPEVNDITTQNPNYKLKMAGTSARGHNNAQFKTKFEHPVDFVTYYNDTAYRIVTANFVYSPILFVEDTVEDEKAAALERIESYLNNDKIKVVIDDITPTFDNTELEAMYLELDEYLANIGLNIDANENTRVYSLKIGATESEKHLFIFKTSKENIKTLEIQSVEKNTGIRFLSTSSIPSDSVFDVVDVSEAYKKINSRIQEAYDIKLFSNTASAYIKSIAGGLKIYLPVADDFNAEGKKIAYLDENGKALEYFDIKMETVDGKKYATFTTEHLSVYAITDGTLDVPDTLKNASLILVFVVLGMTAVGVGLIIKNNREIKA